MSSYLYINKSATTRAVKSLEQKGYVIKYRDDIDKRCNRIYLTDHAKHYMNEIRQRILQWSDFLSEDIDEKTHDLVISTLEKMVDKVEHTNLKHKMGE